jgi:ATP-binding cassette subfamily B protein
MSAHQKQMVYFTSMTGMINAGALVIAVISVVSFNANIAAVFLIFNYTANIVTQLFQFSNQALRNYNRAIGDASDMVAILNTPAEVTDPKQPLKVAMNRGKISFRDVSFAHKDAHDAIFQNLNLRIKPGEKVGLVGHSGSGKSTLVRLLLRFSDIDSGSIEIDGQNIAKVTQNDLRRAIAYVPQEPLLFHRTIAENIGYSNPSAPPEQIAAVAKKANATEFIETLPKKYETLVGERGIKLSGGQRQRIAIARAMLKNAPILVLDEATSALDSASEVLIQDALWKLMEGRTAIIIAHRLSTIQKMDRIIVLDDGKVAEEGTHKELIGKNGVYANLWQHQSGGFLEE